MFSDAREMGKTHNHEINNAKWSSYPCNMLIKWSGTMHNVSDALITAIISILVL